MTKYWKSGLSHFKNNEPRHLVVPAAVERFRGIKGNGQKCVAMAVYGNRDYDDALIELCDLLAANGFQVIAAAAFIGRHCIFPKVAAGRPDSADMAKLADFASEVKAAIGRPGALDLGIVKGNRPYKQSKGVALHPKTDPKKCQACGRCASECPAGAIPADNPSATDKDKCLSCSRCITVCSRGARRFGGITYAAIPPLFNRMCAARREPEWFV